MHTSLARLSRTALVALALGGASHCFAQLMLSNSPAWNGSDYIAPFGEPDIATIGQTFTAEAAHTMLLGFTFHLRSDAGGDVGFRGYVAGWDGAKPTGPLLFMSGVRTLAAGTDTFQPIVFDTGDLALTPGAQYVAFLSASGFFDTIDGTAGVAAPVQSDTYASGNLVIALNGDDFDALFEGAWEEIFGIDLALSMEFPAPAVPEPAAFGMIAAVLLLGLIGARRMQRA